MHNKVAPQHTTPIKPPHCLPIVPLRYAVLCSSEYKLSRMLNPMLANLGEGVKDISLEKGVYTLRGLRSGYFYLLIERFGKRTWQAYGVNDTYNITEIDPLTRVIRHNSQDNDHLLPVIYRANEVETAWFLFTSEPLSPAKLDEYREQADAFTSQGKLQSFSPANATLNKDYYQPHTLHAGYEILKHQLAEFQLFESNTIEDILSDQVYPVSRKGRPLDQLTFQVAKDGVSLGADPKAIALAAFDAIGITHELNDFRNQPIQQFQQQLNEKDIHGYSTQDKLTIANMVDSIKKGFQSGLIESTKKRLRTAERQVMMYDNLLNGISPSDPSYVGSIFEEMHTKRDRMNELFHMGRYEEAKALEQQLKEDQDRIDNIQKRNRKHYQSKRDFWESQRQQEQAQADQKETEAKIDAKWTWINRYAERIDEQDIESFKQRVDQDIENSITRFNERFDDYLQWMSSEALLNAFDVFDPENTISGYNFAVESALCSFGISGTPKGEAIVEEWIATAKPERKNIYLRGVYHNQKTLMDDVGIAFDRMQQEQEQDASMTSEQSDAKEILLFAKVIKGFKSIDSAFDEWVRNFKGSEDTIIVNGKVKKNYTRLWPKSGYISNKVGLPQGIEVTLFHKLWDINRTIFRSGINTATNPLDKVVVTFLKKSLYSRLGDVTEKVQYDVLKNNFQKNTRIRDLIRKDSSVAEASERFSKKYGQKQRNKLSPDNFDFLANDASARRNTSPQLDKILQEVADVQTNNYHHVRISAIMMGFELFSLQDMLFREGEYDAKRKLEITASMMGIASIACDSLYAGTKALRELKQFKDTIGVSGDVVRGGWKFAGASFATGAALSGMVLDISRVGEEWQKSNRDPFKLLLIGGSFVVNLFSSGITLYTGYGYTAELIKRRYMKKVTEEVAKKTTAYLAAKSFAANRVFNLVWLARLSWIGLGITVVEIAYISFSDDDLQDWGEKSVFRRNRYEKDWLGRRKQYPHAQAEINALIEAAQTTLGLNLDTDS